MVALSSGPHAAAAENPARTFGLRRIERIRPPAIITQSVTVDRPEREPPQSGRAARGTEWRETRSGATSRALWLDLGRREDFPSLVLAAVRTDTVGKLLLVTVGANRQPDLRKGVVGPALVASGAGKPSLGIGHRGLS